MNVLAEIQKVKAFAFDVDGVLTDGTLLLFENGLMARRMNIKDGYALQLAVKKGYAVFVISGAESPEVKQRLEKLGVTEVHMGVRNKLSKLKTLLASHKLSLDEVLFMGDDEPDIHVMKEVYFPCCPADAVPAIRSVSKYISKFRGGEGCVRDVIEKTMTLNGHWFDDELTAAI